MCIGSGIGSFEDVYDTSIAYDKGVSVANLMYKPQALTSHKGPKKVSPLFVPRLLINLAAGHISMKYGFKVSTTLAYLNHLL